VANQMREIVYDRDERRFNLHGMRGGREFHGDWHHPTVKSAITANGGSYAAEDSLCFLTGNMMLHVHAEKHPDPKHAAQWYRYDTGKIYGVCHLVRMWANTQFVDCPDIAAADDFEANMDYRNKSASLPCEPYEEKPMRLVNGSEIEVKPKAKFRLTSAKVNPWADMQAACRVKKPQLPAKEAATGDRMARIHGQKPHEILSPEASLFFEQNATKMKEVWVQDVEDAVMQMKQNVQSYLPSWPTCKIGHKLALHADDLGDGFLVPTFKGCGVC